jgi:short-subunit dehydrogenase
MTTSRKVAIVTGASSGIGRATALHLAAHNWTVVIVGRRASNLTALTAEIRKAGGSVVSITADVTAQKDVTRIVDQAWTAGGRIDALLNIAGIGGMDSIMTNDESLQSILETNVVAPVRLMRAVIPIMKTQRSGTIVNVGSVAGEIAIGGLYSATKFAIRGLTYSARRELKGTGIHVALVEPGFIETEMTVDHKGRMPGPEIVAAAIESCLKRNRHKVVVPARYRFLILLANLAPGIVNALYNGKIDAQEPDSKPAGRP